MDHDDSAREVAAMQFAGGRLIAEIAAEWERDVAWVEEAIRHALLEMIPRCEGGLKIAREEARARRRAAEDDEANALREAQGELKW
jgi:hypothetical protein